MRLPNKSNYYNYCCKKEPKLLLEKTINSVPFNRMKPLKNWFPFAIMKDSKLISTGP